MQSIRMAAAQSISIAGDISANVLTHIKFIEAAHQASIELLVFPELSLSGYELPLLQQCALEPLDPRLDPIKDLVRKTNMTVIVGAPIVNGAGVAPAIGALTFFPDGRHDVYLKQYLHPGEELFASKGEKISRIHQLNGLSYSLAICADITHAQHALQAAMAGASLYLAGVLISEAGYNTDTNFLQSYALDYNFAVLMANHGAPSGGYISAGKSAFWLPNGELLLAAPSSGNVLVSITNHSGNWTGELIEVGN